MKPARLWDLVVVASAIGILYLLFFYNDDIGGASVASVTVGEVTVKSASGGSIPGEDGYDRQTVNY